MRTAVAHYAHARAAFAQAGPGLDRMVSNVECRSGSCRIEIDPSAMETLNSQLPAITAYLAQTMPNVSLSQSEPDDGQQGTVIYLKR